VNYYRAIPLEGKKVQNVVDDLHRRYIDVEVEVLFQRREYAGYEAVPRSRRPRRGHRRLSSLHHESAANRVSPGDLATIYRCRWEAQLLSRELKTR
jgi:IS4 transposase